MGSVAFADLLRVYWSATEVTVNLVVFMNLAGALVLGLIIGYERSYHGRAAGMRTYGLVCTASAALTVIVGYPEFWYGGFGHATPLPDATRVIQGIVTGIGFLGAGVIMKEGFNISGLTTAASIWSSSVVGVMVGVGFYAAAILLTLLSVFCMLGVSRLESWLPNRQAVMVTLRFRQGFKPREDVLVRIARERGYQIATGTLTVDFQNGCPEWRFIAVADGKNKGAPIPVLAEELTRFEGVETFHLARARN
ncbi:MAG: MgtC/SapB family protein [Proteobacteria bacterium]|nr:MgtC/SapB family protein [Pseudomonadota bacterium]HQR03367.1 MgtC/SapB family protein [Rhodocyclaceae bacterium]